MTSSNTLPYESVPWKTARKIEGKAKRTKAVHDGKRIDAVALEWRFRGEQSWRTLIVTPDGSPGNTYAETAAAAQWIIHALADQYVRAV